MPPIRAVPRAAAHPPPRVSGRPARRPARTATRGQRRLGVALLGLLAASFAALLFVLYELFAGAGPAPTTTRAAPAIPANARRFNTLAELEKTKLAPGTPFAITLSEAELNQRLSAELAKQPNLPFRNVTARVLVDHVDFSGLAKAAGVEVSSTVAIRFFAQSGKIGYEITSINFGPVPVPGIARQAIQDNVDQQLSSQKLTDQWVIDDIQMHVGAVTVVGHPR